MKQDLNIKPEFNLPQSIEDTVQEMLKDKEDNPDILIPLRFLELYNRPEMLDLVLAIYNYLQELFKLETKLETLRADSKSREMTIPTLQPQEVRLLNDKAKLVALRYSWLLIHYRSSKGKQEDQSLFETIIYFIARVLHQAFERAQLPMLEEELNRLFRSTAFNVSYRRNIETEKQRRFPYLTPIPRASDTNQVIQHINLRTSIPREKIKLESSATASVRPNYVRLSAYKAIHARSPLISLILPSNRDKIRAFEESRRRKRTQRNHSSQIRV